MVVGSRHKHLAAAIVMIAACVIASPATAGRLYEEHFATRQYLDTLNTSACWDTVYGQIRLNTFELMLADTCDTPGDARKVAVSGDYAYVADGGSGLQVIDISNPEAPFIAGSYDTLGQALSVIVSGDYACVANYDHGVLVVDISDPENPTRAGSCGISANAIDLAVHGDYLLVAGYSAGLRVVDITDPGNPTLLAGSYYNTPGYSWGVAVDGDRAYVADGPGGLQVIDISDPENPAYASNIPMDFAYSVAISGDIAYVAASASGMLVVDISDPDDPNLVGTFATSGTAKHVTVSGDYAYLACDNAGLLALDIRDPASPRYAGEYATPTLTLGVAVAGEYAYLASWDVGLEIVDIADHAGPTHRGDIDFGNTYRIAISGDYAFFACPNGPLQVADISNPTNPASAGSSPSLDCAYDITLAGDYAYVAEEDSGLHVLDITDPENPVSAGSYPTTSKAWSVAVAGDYLLLGLTSRLEVLDISDPADPQLLGLSSSVPDAKGIAVAGDYAYLACNNQGLRVIDISDPTDISLAGGCNLSGPVTDVAVYGDYAYVTHSADGLFVFDIHDPGNPFYVPTAHGFEGARGIVIEGDRAFVATGYNGLHAWDISDPTSITIVGTSSTADYALDVAVAGDYAYVAIANDGLEVKEIFRRPPDNLDNIVRSLAVDGDDDEIRFFRLETIQGGDIIWKLSSDGGGTWQEVLPDNQWNAASNTGTDLMWRSTLVSTYAYPSYPFCSYIGIEWLLDHAVIDSIMDVPNDQGGQARIVWTRSAYDLPESGHPVTGYEIYRKVDHGLAATRSEDGASARGPGEGGADAPTLAYPPGDWDYVATVPAGQEDRYSAIVPTLADSTITGGMYHTTFFIRTRTDTLWIHFDSPPDSGYTVDNLAPHVPLGFAVAYNTGSGNALAWEECPDGDFQYFRIYRGESGDFVPSEANYIHGVTGTGWTDTVEDGWKYHYKVSAVDFSGNESDPASPGTVTGGETPGAPPAFALHQNSPNPFNPATSIRFEMREKGRMTIRIYDVAGRLVATLVDGVRKAGPNTVTWNGRNDLGASVASGVYFCRMEAKEFAETRKMVLLR